MKNFTILLFSVFYSSFLFSQQPDFINNLDSYAKDAIDKWQIPGMSICIVKDGEVVYLKGFGVREQGKGGAIDKNTLFLIGSNSKAFTGTALAMLEHEGLCSMNDRVIKWYPNFKMKDEWVTKNATLTDIVTHRDRKSVV